MTWLSTTRLSPTASSGSATSWLLANFPQGASTTEASPTSGPATSAPPSTPSPVSAAGPSPSAWQAGLTISPSGPGLALASRSLQQVVEAASTTSATSGPTGSTSSASAALQSCLESRLRALLEGRGSTLFSLTWKEQVTPAGRQFCLLRASAPRTGGTEPTSWPTAQEANSRESANNSKGDLSLVGAARLTSWMSPRARGDAGGSRWETGDIRNLEDQARTAGRPTPIATSHQASENNSAYGPKNGVSLAEAAARSAWGTPTSRDWKDGDCSHLGLPVKGLVSRQVLGVMSSGSSAPTGGVGQLNQEFVRWIMGYPAAWGSFAPTATRSSRRSLPRSSAPLQARSVTPSVFVFSRTGLACRC